MDIIEDMFEIGSCIKIDIINTKSNEWRSADVYVNPAYRLPRTSHLILQHN